MADQEIKTDTLFENPEEEALSQIIAAAAHEAEQTVYDYLEQTPKTSFVVEIVAMMHRQGYKITKM